MKLFYPKYKNGDLPYKYTSPNAVSDLCQFIKLGKTPSFTDCPKLRSLYTSFNNSFGIILDAIAEAKKLICKFKAQNLKQDSLTMRYFSFGNGI